MSRSLAVQVAGYGLLPGGLVVGGLVGASRAGVLPVQEGLVLVVLLNLGGLLAYVSSGATNVAREAYQTPTGGMDEIRSRRHDEDRGYFATWQRSQVAVFLFAVTVAALSALWLVVSVVR